MTEIFGDDADIYVGDVDTDLEELVKDVEVNETDPDDEELPETPPVVNAILAFDPKEFNEAPRIGKYVLEKIAQLGCDYCKKYLRDPFTPQALRADWQIGLEFFFSRSFARGRRDELSNEYFRFTISCLQEKIFAGNPERSYATLQGFAANSEFDWTPIEAFKRRHGLKRKMAIKHDRFKTDIAATREIVCLLTTLRDVELIWKDKPTRRKNLGLEHDLDLRMVLNTLDFISKHERRNIYAYVLSRIRKVGVQSAGAELQTEIRGVGDKIAGLVIRDILLMNPELHSELGIDDDEYEFAFPVDTWVEQMAAKLDCSARTPSEIKKCFVNSCRSCKINPLLVAAGMWHLGSNSLDILLAQIRANE